MVKTYKACCPHCGLIVSVQVKGASAVIHNHVNPHTRAKDTCTGSNHRVSITQVAEVSRAS